MRTLMNGLKAHERYPVAESSQVGSLRRAVAGLARDQGMSQEQTAKAAIMATEMGTNLVKHAHGGGEVLVRAIAGRFGGLELLSLDKGPGMENPAHMLQDGVSTMGSAGTGLGALRRLSNEFAIYSRVGSGTVVLVRSWASHYEEQPNVIPCEMGMVMLPKPGEEACGDGWCVSLTDNGLTVLVIDGLGHGPQAAAASQEAVRAFSEQPDLVPSEAVHNLHGRLRHTRGAAAAVADIRTGRDTLVFAGIGNIAGRIVRPDGAMTSLVSMSGIVGHQFRKLLDFSYAWGDDDLLVMNTDGLRTGWDFSAYPGLEHQHPAIIAGVLYRDFVRGSDDVAVVVLRMARSGRR
ncbi:ATP-binding protein [Desulfocurvibacter africanus]|uniref:ATP-binding protein n=1 Tax=Desulfocurvibacter africanus TaxID=873 RepID=UPI00041B5B5B|nr:ATP-binding protein [Desulfocurvibacter africanus]